MDQEGLSMKLSRNFPLNGMRVFEAAARHLSFTRAGEELGMTQTAVSYQIKLLEEMLGEQLFLRRPRQVTLTEAGASLAPKVAEAFGLLQEAVANMRETAQVTLTIHCTATFAQQWLARRIGDFQIRHPNIAVRLEASSALIDFNSAEADIAIRTGDGKWPGLYSQFLIYSGFTPMLSPALAQSVGGLHRPEDLLKLRIIDPSDPWWRIWFTAAGVADPDLDSRPRSRLGAQTFEANAAMAGQGVGILTPKFYRDEIAMGRLFQPFDIMGRDGHDYWLAYPEAKRKLPKIRAFHAWIVETLATDGLT
ncbi:LysR substrate-binding domain-containing protein [Rhizobium sp. S95]|uniref:LysR substrate-binding domain-containing protein n=2 Tax=Alphaproteobacteria TaxID=28211 RepID=A0AAJ1F4S5_9HYPH|nr:MULTISPECIES: LysR substrate-binding domain-containing protein [unclassified Ciceribacter]MCM2398789.1 LysR substrate-binding domain-containing protein [Ciceribacter sp. S95]MCO5957005.1 LysR substrate-binding domain-containing protein [Ciceribacter sp. S101]